MVLKEEKRDLFSVDDKYYFVHCISCDCKMGAGIAVEFKSRYGLSCLEKMAFKWLIGEVALIDNCFSLFTKGKYWNKPTYSDFTKAIETLKEWCLRMNIKYLAMPRIGCGLDKLKWEKVKQIIETTFKDTDIEILVCYL